VTSQPCIPGRYPVCEMPHGERDSGALLVQLLGVTGDMLGLPDKRPGSAVNAPGPA
jgi:hypothetical protein